MNTKNLEYAFVRSEKTSEVIIIIKVNPEWIGQEIDLSVRNEDMEIMANNQRFKTGKLPRLVSDWLKNNSTTVYFANEDGEFISEVMVGGD